MAEHMNEEEMKALQEKIKNMSPDELREFQKKQCIFCQIISGKIPSKKVYEDSDCLGILDINPANPGHVLVMPREHYSIMPQLPEELLGHLFSVVKLLSNAILRGLEVQGANVLVANGAAAGQKAQHFMIHCIPRKDEDGVAFDIPQKAHSEEELQKLAGQLLGALGSKKKDQKKPEENIVDADFSEREEAQKTLQKTQQIQKPKHEAKEPRFEKHDESATQIFAQGLEEQLDMGEDELEEPIEEPKKKAQAHQQKKPASKPKAKKQINNDDDEGDEPKQVATSSANRDDIARILGAK